MAVEDRLLRALAVLRWVVLVNAVGLNLWRHDNFVHPRAGIVVVLVLVAWTAYATWAYRDAARRTTWLLAADLAIAVGAILVSPVVKGEQLRATIPGFWVMGALLAWAVHWRWRGGLFAAACLTAADLAIRHEVTQSNYGNVFLLMLGGPIVGYVSQQLQREFRQGQLGQGMPEGEPDEGGAGEGPMDLAQRQEALRQLMDALRDGLPGAAGDAVREALREAERNMGEARDGLEALARLAAPESRVDLTVSDVVMPKMGGVELLEAVRASAPSHPMVLVTGYDRHRVLDNRDEIPRCRVLAKPFDCDELCASIEALLAADDGA